jgi:ZipA, C-terminal FtsZ-binding domain
MGLEQITATLGLSELQFALGLIGIFLVVLVAIVNLRSARAKRQAHTPVESGFADAVGQNHLGDRVEPGFAEPMNVAPTEAPRFAIDPRIDCVITLRFENPIKGSEIMGEVADWPRFGAHWIYEGLRVDDTKSDWEPIGMDANYAELQLAIQLASRKGPIGVLELSDFCSRSQALAEVLGAQIDMPSVSTMIESAKELDAIAAESDIQLSINVAFDGKAKTRAELDALMLERNFVLSKNNRSYVFYSNNQILFASSTLDPDQPVTGISLLLELPLVAQEQMGFERMLAEGVAVAESMQGRIVDDNGVNLTENAVIAIRQHLDGLYSRLELSGIAAGSATAARLFN